MPGKKLAIGACLVSLLAGCAVKTPLWRQEAQAILASAEQGGAGKLLPEETSNLAETLGRGESLLLSRDVERAEAYFHLAVLKGKVLEKDLVAEQQRLAEAELRREAELKAAEQRRAEEAERRRVEDLAAARAREEAQLILQAKPRPEKKSPRTLSTYHTVKYGETLPQIAAQPDVYNEPTLWPLLYRANRDQISNPRHIWPGQVLKIPRNYSREDIAEARRYAQDKRL